MREKSFDRLFNRYFTQKDTIQPLMRLEGDVWYQINARKHGMRQSWLRSVFSTLLMPQYQVATVALAITFGLFVGHLTTGNLNTENPSARQALNLQVFSAQDSVLFNNYRGERV